MDLQETKLLPKFGQLEKDWSPLAAGPLCFFFLIELLKKKCVDKNNKIKILRTFDNPISKNRTQNKKSFLLGLAVLDYFPNSKRVLKVGFDTYILHNFSKFCHGVFYQFVSFNIISRLLPKIINMYF